MLRLEVTLGQRSSLARPYADRDSPICGPSVLHLLEEVKVGLFRVMVWLDFKINHWTIWGTNWQGDRVVLQFAGVDERVKE